MFNRHPSVGKPIISIMPSFRSLEIEEIQDKNGKLEKIGHFNIKTRPLGFRGTKGLSWILHLFPYLTGCTPKFRFAVEHFSDIGTAPFRIDISQRRDAEPADVILWDKSDGEIYNRIIEAPAISISGQYRYSVGLQSKVGASCNDDIVIFKALAQESVTIPVLIGLLSAAIGAGVGSFMTWLFMK